MIYLSIIIPLYNLQNLIIPCLNSIPIRDDIEIIVIDDNSTDDSLDVVECWMLENKRDIRLICSKTNDGCAASFDKGLDIAKGEYIVQLDADDYLYTDNFCNLLDQRYTEDMIWFDLESRDFIWKKSLMPEMIDHSCLFRREFIGDIRMPNVRHSGGLPFYKELMAKPHTERYTHMLCYYYNFPRENSIRDRVNKGEL